jgi:DNA recombination protein RmuC
MSSYFSEPLFFLLIGLVVGVLLGLLLALVRARRMRSDEESLRIARAVLEERCQGEARAREALEAALQDREHEISDLKKAHEGLSTQIASLETELRNEREQGEQRLADLRAAREQLTHEFKVLANEILEEKSKKFSEQNQTSLQALLDPLKERIQLFQGKVEEVYVNEGQQRSQLAEQVRQLLDLNRQLSDDAGNLTRALKGQSKMQGNWGELILERVLDAAGLIEGTHYQTQVSHHREDGTRAQPDVVLKLPEDRQLVIDAKVSLTAYEAWVNAETDDIRKVELKRHIESVRNHMRGLSGKNYQELYQLNSLDFVIMFVPVEPAFHLAIAEDEGLWQEAWERNVLLVSSSTLLFVVRTVSHLWRQEQQSQNAREIARRGGELYDKLCAFVGDLEGIGRNLTQAQNAHQGALTKLTGRGSLINRAEQLRKLGVKATKSLPAGFLESADADESSEETGNSP